MSATSGLSHIGVSWFLLSFRLARTQHRGRGAEVVRGGADGDKAEGFRDGGDGDNGGWREIRAFWRLSETGETGKA